MARIRNIKPQFFKDAELFDAEKESGLPLRVAYAGLWTVADREGRFKWKPREIKTDVLPFDDLDMGQVLEALGRHNFIYKYHCAGQVYGFIHNFKLHQFINKNEVASQIPAPPENISEQTENIPKHSKIVSNCETLDTDTDISDTDTDTGLVAASAAPPPAKRRVLSAIPENFPPPSLVVDACSFWKERQRHDLCERADDEAQAFRDHHAAHASRMADWPATWRTWVRNALRFNKQSAKGRNAHENAARGIWLAAGGDIDPT